jgi:hypothetical protein
LNKKFKKNSESKVASALGIDKLFQKYENFQNKKERAKMMNVLEQKIAEYDAKRYIFEFKQKVEGQKLVSNAVILFSRIIQPLIWSHPKILSLPGNKL